MQQNVFQELWQEASKAVYGQWHRTNYKNGLEWTLTNEAWIRDWILWM
jgi:hypothetical protein